MKILIHYGEIWLKGKNRPFFESKLLENIRTALERSQVEEGLLFATVSPLLLGLLLLHGRNSSPTSPPYRLTKNGIHHLRTMGVAVATKGSRPLLTLRFPQTTRQTAILKEDDPQHE